MASRKGKINELYDFAAIEAQQAKVIGLMSEFVDAVGKVKPISLKVDGAEKTKDIIDGVKDLSKATAEVSAVSSKAVNSMGELIDMSKKAAGSYEQQANLITKFAGSLDQNIKLQTQYKIRLEEISKEMKTLSKSTNDLEKNSESYRNKVQALTKEQLELKNASAAVGQTIKAQIKDSQAAEHSYDALNQRVGLLRDAYRQLSETERNSEAGHALLAQIAPLDAKLKELDAGIGNFQRNVGNYGQAFSGSLATLEGALGEVKTKIDEMNQSGNINAEVMASLEKEYAALSTVVENQEAGFVSMRQEIQANEKAIEAMIALYGQESSLVQELIVENGKLRDTFEDLVQTQKTLGSDTFGLDAMLQGAQALVGVYSAAQGAAALFGEESEDLQKTMVKLQAAMALVQGIQAVVNALQSQGALIQGVMAARTFVTSIAMKAYAFATSGATAAARTFNTVLLASGIGIVLTLIATAANAMGAFDDETEDATKSVSELNKELEELRQQLHETADAADELRHAKAGGVNELRREIQLLEASGATDAEVHKKRKELLNAELYDLQVRKATFYDDAAEQLKIEEQIKDKKTAIRAEDLKLAKKQGDERLKNDKEAAEKSKDYAEREFKARFDLQKYYLQKEVDEQKDIAEDSAIPQSIRLAALMASLEKQEEIVEAQRKFDLASEKVTASQKILINQKAQNDINNIRSAGALRAIEIQKELADKEQQFFEQGSAAIQEGIESGLLKKLDNQLASYQRVANEELQIELDRYSKGQISKEQYEERKLAIQNDVNRKSLLAQIKYYEELTMLSNLSAEDEAAALKALAELRQKLLDGDVAATEKANEEKKKSNKELLEEQRDLLFQLANEINDTVFTVLEGGIDKQKNAIRDQMDLLEAQKQKEIEVVNQSVASQQDKADQIAIIEARAQSQKEQLEKRQRDLDVQKAKFDRARAVMNIISNTAQGITSALATYPPNPILAAIIGAIGAAQLVKTLAVPIPKYKFGTDDHPGGDAIVGDGGKHEYVVTPEGEVYKTPAESTLVDLPAHSKVFKDEFDFMNAIHNGFQNSTMRIEKTPNDYYHFQNMTEKLSGKLDKVVKTIQNIPQPIFEGRPGLRGWVYGNGSMSKYLNK